MTHTETQQMAVKLLGRACLHGFISKDVFTENIPTESMDQPQVGFEFIGFIKQSMDKISLW